MRLIDPNTLRQELDKLDCIDKFGYVILPITKLNIALERSTVDAVAVCRCKDCKLHDNCYTEDVFKFARLNDDRRFCGVGERKGGDE